MLAFITATLVILFSLNILLSVMGWRAEKRANNYARKFRRLELETSLLRREREEQDEQNAETKRQLKVLALGFASLRESQVEIMKAKVALAQLKENQKEDGEELLATFEVLTRERTRNLRN